MAYNPMTQDRRGEFILAGSQRLGAGISGGLQSLGDAIGKMKERKEAEKKEAQSLRGIAKAYGWEQAETSDLKGLRTWFSMKQAQDDMEQKAMQRDELRASLQSIQQDMRQKEAQANVSRLLGDAFRSYPTQIDQIPGTEQPSTGNVPGLNVPQQQVGRAPTIAELFNIHSRAGAPIPNELIQQLGAIEREKLQLMQPLKAPNRPNAIEVLEEADRIEQSAEERRMSGDTEGYQRLMNNASMLRGSISQPSREMQVTTDPSGRPVVTVREGVKSTTLGTAGAAERKIISADNAFSIGTYLLNNLREGDVGAEGWIKERYVDRGLAQLMPERADKKRVENREMLRQYRAKMQRLVSDDPEGRFSNTDREEINQSVSGLEFLTGFDELKTRIERINKILANSARTWAIRTNQPEPDYAKSPERLVEEYVNQRAGLNKLVQEKRMTQQQADAALELTLKRIQDAGRQYFGVEIEP